VIVRDGPGLFGAFEWWCVVVGLWVGVEEELLFAVAFGWLQTLRLGSDPRRNAR
jgi:hypothetical protein